MYSATKFKKNLTMAFRNQGKIFRFKKSVKDEGRAKVVWFYIVKNERLEIQTQYRSEIIFSRDYEIQERPRDSHVEKWWDGIFEEVKAILFFSQAA